MKIFQLQFSYISAAKITKRKRHQLLYTFTGFHITITSIAVKLAIGGHLIHTKQDNGIDQPMRRQFDNELWVGTAATISQPLE